MDENSKCSVPGCGRPVHAHELCNSHYKAKLRKRKKEIIDIYKSHHEEIVSKKDMPVKRGMLYKEICPFVINYLRTSNPADLEKWIEEKITLPYGNGYGGSSKMNFSLFPHMRQILRLVDNPDCKKIVLCFAAQSGKTDTIASIAAYLTGYRHRRGLYVLPTARLFDKVRDTRLLPLFQNSDVGFKYLKNKMAFMFSVNFFALGLASSAGTLAEQTGTSWVIIDELDEYSQETAKAEDPVALAEKRMQASSRKLLIVACTPKRTEVNYTYDHYERSKKFIEEIRCPLCDGWFVPDFYKHFKWPKEAEDQDFNFIETQHLAWVECPLCLGKITDAMHYEIVTGRKRWKDLNPNKSIAECGFLLPIYLTPRKNFSATSTEYLKSRHDVRRLADFNNSLLARPVKAQEARSGDDIDYSRLKSDYYIQEREIPADVFALGAGVDVGHKEIWLVLLGWSAHDVKYVIRSERIDRGIGAESLEVAMDKATEICTMEYRCKGALEPKFFGGLIDSGDGNDTYFVYDYCLKSPFWTPSKGYGQQQVPYVISRVDAEKRYSKYKSLSLLILNTHMLNDSLHNYLSTRPGERHSIQFSADAPDILFDHLNNEEQRQVNAGGRIVFRWQKKKRRDDHLRDALLHAIAFGMVRGFDNIY
jgi:phage terminase large subunit GpA-like protein